MGKSILQTCGRSQGTCPERGRRVVYERSLVLDGARALRHAANLTRDVRWYAVAVVIERCGFGRRRSRAKRLGLKSDKQAGNHISRSAVPGTIAQNRRPRFMIPGDDISLSVEAGALIHHKRETVIFPRHLVFSRELHTDRFLDG